MVLLDLIGGAAELLKTGMDLFGDDDKEKARLLLKEMDHLQAQNMAQAKINEVQAAHRSIFVAGPRPFIMWICGLGLTSEFLIRPWVMAFWPHVLIPSISDVIIELIFALSGLAGLRTFEKNKGLTK